MTYHYPFNVSGDGQHLITYWSIDNAGNYEPYKQQPFKMDTIVPVYVEKCRHVSRNNFCSYVVADDATSGVNRIEFYQGQELIGNDSEPPYYCILHHPLPNGNFTFKILAYDNAGLSMCVCDGIPPDITHVWGLVKEVVNNSESITFRAILTIYDGASGVPLGLLPFPRLLLPRKFTFHNPIGTITPTWIDIYLLPDTY